MVTGGWEINTALLNRLGPIQWRRIAIGASIGLFTFLLDIRAHLDAGIPYGGDMLSNLIPALYFRSQLVMGGNILITPWYGGMPIWGNVFFKGFYPPWSMFFIPGLPVKLWLAILVAGHHLAAGIFAYYFARQELNFQYALPIAIVFALPVAAHNAHISKTLAWPWVVLGVWHLRPIALTETPRRAGMIVGIAGGAIVLIANLYYALYLAILAGAVYLAMRAWVAIRAAAVASVLVALPKLLSLVPALVEGGRSTVLQDGMTLQPLAATLIGFWYDSGFVIWSAINKDAYAVVSAPICLLAGGTMLWSYAQPRRFPTRWLLGILSAMMAGLLIITASPLVYRWPGMRMFRVPHRATLIIAVGCILLTVEIVTAIQDSSWDIDAINYALSTLLILAVLTASVPPILQNTMWENATEPTVGQDVAATVAEHGCRPVWVETNANWNPDDKSARYHKEIAYGLAEAGIPATAISYAKIGQDYATHNDSGQLTFDALILQGNARLPPNQSVTLTGGWFQPTRGTIQTSQFSLLETVDAPRGDIHIYAVNGTC